MLGRMWVVGLVFLSGMTNGAAQNPLAGDPKAAKAGEYEFRINCALCHGLGARGGGRGPDLTRAQKKHAHSDAEMFQIISNGIPGTAMPARYATWSRAKVGDLVLILLVLANRARAKRLSIRSAIQADGWRGD